MTSLFYTLCTLLLGFEVVVVVSSSSSSSGSSSSSSGSSKLIMASFWKDCFYGFLTTAQHNDNLAVGDYVDGSVETQEPYTVPH